MNGVINDILCYMGQNKFFKKGKYKMTEEEISMTVR